MQNAIPPFNRNQIKQDFNRAAYSYDMHALLQRRVADALFQTMRNQPSPNNHILDAGCGTGYFHELVRKHGYHWSITQLDLAYRMCKIAAGYASPATYGGTYTVNGDIASLPLPNGYFGRIFTSLTVQWAISPDRVYKEFHRVLAEDGTLYISTLLPGTLSELENSFIENNYLSPINHFLPVETITSQLEKVGFQHIETNEAHIPLHYNSVLQLIRSLKAIGARKKSGEQQSHYLGKKGLQAIEDYYQQHFGDDQGLPATWHAAYITARK